jgi:hypothetical protein
MCHCLVRNGSVERSEQVRLLNKRRAEDMDAKLIAQVQGDELPFAIKRFGGVKLEPLETKADSCVQAVHCSLLV